MLMQPLFDRDAAASLPTGFSTLGMRRGASTGIDDRDLVEENAT